MKRAVFALLLCAYAVAVPGADAPLRVGSKNFTESIVLAELLRLDAQRHGLALEHARALGGSAIVWKALLEGSIDAYPEYTGTLTQELLHDLPANAGSDRLSARLRMLGIGVGATLGFEDGYALGMPEALAQRLQIRTLTDLRQHPKLRLALSNEFMNRADGWPKLRAIYALTPTDLKGLDHSLAYRALSQGAADVIDLYSTDPEIVRDHVRVLIDDQHAFPSYQAIWLYRLDSARRAPTLVQALADFNGRISASQMQTLNAAVQLQQQSETGAARSFLAVLFPPTSDNRSGPDAGPPLGMRIAERALEHLRLVAVSLAGALLLGLPLGIAAAKLPKLGRWLLAIAVVVQTVPTLAMLVFMIPLLGIGAKPAIATLFLYSLLPIVRNTATGLSSIPNALLESGSSLGLPWRVRLLRIELPLAAPVIIAGISTAAVINVGTATLGALIGAGGFGEPILTGIRLNSVPLILEGAIPAAVLALLVMAAFQLLERAMTPRGLRLRFDG